MLRSKLLLQQQSRSWIPFSQRNNPNTPVTITITGAAGQIGYALAPLIARGDMLGDKQKVSLRLLDLPNEKSIMMMEATRMELLDCAFPLLVDSGHGSNGAWGTSSSSIGGVLVTTDPREAFANCDLAILCGSFPRKNGMERKDLLSINAKIFTEQGRIMGEVGSPHCRALVVGNPANTNALLFATAAQPHIDPRNVTALMRLDLNRATAQTALKIGVPINSVKNCIVWGNHSATQVPDINAALVASKDLVDDGQHFRSRSVRDFLKTRDDHDFFDDEQDKTKFIGTIQQRGLTIINARGGQGSALSAASAIVDHVHDWIVGIDKKDDVTTDRPPAVCLRQTATSSSSFVSMGIIGYDSKNSYKVPAGLCFSFPVTCADGKWEIVEGIEMSSNVKRLVDVTTKELLAERLTAKL